MTTAAVAETLIELASASLKGKAQQKYPIEQGFGLPLLGTAAVVLLPALALVAGAPPPADADHAYQALFGNWISPFVLWFFVASMVHLVLKRRRLQREMRTTDLLATQVIPAVLGRAPPDLPVLDLLRRLRDELAAMVPGYDPWNLLLTRCRLLLGHDNRGRCRAADMPDDDEAGLFEREYMRSSFALPRYMVWAIPILGFIGTVWGISQGIAEFSGAMGGVDAASDLSAMLKERLPLVTANLATAFDTTFLALLLSIPLMLTLTWLEKAEERYLITLDELWLYELGTRLRRRLPTAATETGETPSAAPAPTATDQVPEELRLLSEQVRALHEIVRDLYETLFLSGLGQGQDREPPQ